MKHPQIQLLGSARGRVYTEKILFFKSRTAWIDNERDLTRRTY